LPFATPELALHLHDPESGPDSPVCSTIFFDWQSYLPVGIQVYHNTFDGFYFDDQEKITSCNAYIFFSLSIPFSLNLRIRSTIPEWYYFLKKYVEENDGKKNEE